MSLNEDHAYSEKCLRNLSHVAIKESGMVFHDQANFNILAVFSHVVYFNLIVKVMLVYVLFKPTLKYVS